VVKKCVVFQLLRGLVALAAVTFESFSYSTAGGKRGKTHELLLGPNKCHVTTHLPSFLCPFFEWYLIPFTFL
jgi:hypothetical protein